MARPRTITQKEKKVLDWLRERPGGHRLEDIVANTGLIKSSVVAVLGMLAHQGLIKREDEPRTPYQMGRPYKRYSYVEQIADAAQVEPFK